MKIHLHYRDPTRTHCCVGVSIDGVLTGTLCLRQEELVPFQMVLVNGLHPGLDHFTSNGDPTPPKLPEASNA